MSESREGGGKEGRGGREEGHSIQMQVFVFLYKGIGHLTHLVRSDMIS